MRVERYSDLLAVQNDTTVCWLSFDLRKLACIVSFIYLFNEDVSSPDFVASNDGMINQWIRIDLEGGGRG